MKSTVVDQDGRVRCPACGADSFVEKRTGKAKWLAVPTVGIGVLAAPKRLKCSGCGTNLRRGDGRAEARAAETTAAMRADIDRDRAATQEAMAGAVGDPLPEGVHPRSLRARQIRKARERAAQRPA